MHAIFSKPAPLLPFTDQAEVSSFLLQAALAEFDSVCHYFTVFMSREESIERQSDKRTFARQGHQTIGIKYCTLPLRITFLSSLLRFFSMWSWCLPLLLSKPANTSSSNWTQDHKLSLCRYLDWLPLEFKTFPKNERFVVLLLYSRQAYNLWFACIYYCSSANDSTARETRPSS